MGGCLVGDFITTASALSASPIFTCMEGVATPVGCIDYSLSEENCTGTWLPVALNESMCRNHGYGCHDELGFPEVTRKNQSDCQSCGGRYG